YIISDEVSGLDELFKGRVSTYSTVDELNTLIDDALNNPKKVSNDISGHTYEDRVNQFMDVIN
ncbi:glycosyltransferase, partial [Methanosphaera sp.]